MIVRELTAKEAAKVQKYAQRAKQAYSTYAQAQEALADLRDLLCGEGETLDLDQMAIVKKPAEPAEGIGDDGVSEAAAVEEDEEDA